MDANGSGRGLKVGFLVVGAGNRGARRAAAVAATPGARLIAVHDNDGTAAQALAVRHGAQAPVGYASALADDTIGAVVITTPHAAHFEQAWAALEAGKHVLCEAPLALRPKQGRMLAARADELGLVLATGFPARFLPPVRDALALVAAWRIGRIESVRVTFQRAATPAFLASWQADAEQAGGGVLMDGGLTACDLIRQFAGEVVAARGAVHHRLDDAAGCDSDVHAHFRDHDRATGELRAGWDASARRTSLSLEVQGTHGRLHVATNRWHLSGTLSGGQVLFRPYLTERIAERVFRERHGCERSLALELEAFLGAVKGRRLSRSEASGWDGSRVLEMVEAVYRADRAGEEVPVHPEKVRRLGVAHQPVPTGRRVA